jgi:HD-GYP domain-containing protein (c-di-GMP phosphodiesterase class II)
MLDELLGTVESRDPSLRGHSARVKTLAEAVAGRLEWDEPSLAALRTGARLHDVGKITVPRRILRKPEPLSRFELHWIRGHPEAGMRLLERTAWARPSLPAILFHHERWDGSGYPHGFARTQIPLEARLLAVADAFDAMTSERPYRAALAPSRAFAELERCAGTQFDPDLVAVFLDVWAVRSRAVAAL